MRINTIRLGYGPCPYCGDMHISLDLDENSDHHLFCCPQIPEGTFYIDTQHKKGPRGSLYRLGDVRERSEA